MLRTQAADRHPASQALKLIAVFGENGQGLVVAIVYSTGKNFTSAQDAATAAAAGRTDEAANLNGDRIFVYHGPTGTDAATGGEFDDQFLWITTGEFYGRLIAAGVLP